MPAGEIDRGGGDSIPNSRGPYGITYDSLFSLQSDRATPSEFPLRRSDFINISLRPTVLHESGGGVSNPRRDWAKVTPRLLIRSGIQGLAIEDHFGNKAFIPIRDEDTIIVERGGQVIIDPNDPDGPERYHRFDPRNFKSCEFVKEEPIDTPKRKAAGASVHRLGGLMELKVYIPTDEPPSGELKIHYGDLDLESHPHRSGFTQKPEIEVVLKGPEDVVRRFAARTFDTPEENIIDLDAVERENRQNTMQQAA